MPTRVVIFGTGEAAELAHFYLTHDSPYEPVAFTVDAAYRKQETFCNLPVISFDEVTSTFPPERFAMFVAVGYTRINEMRAAKYAEAKGRGYTLISYVSSAAYVYPGFQPGDNCFILEHAVVQPFASIGSDVILWSGSHIGHHTSVGDHCFIAPRAAISGCVTIEDHCFIGINASVRDHVTIARKSVIGAGAIVLKDTAAGQVCKGHQGEILEISSEQLSGL